MGHLQNYVFFQKSENTDKIYNTTLYVELCMVMFLSLVMVLSSFLNFQNVFIQQEWMHSLSQCGLPDFICWFIFICQVGSWVDYHLYIHFLDYDLCSNYDEPSFFNK